MQHWQICNFFEKFSFWGNKKLTSSSKRTRIEYCRPIHNQSDPEIDFQLTLEGDF